MAQEIKTNEICEECCTLGQDYTTNDKGRLVCRCDECPMNPQNEDDLK